MVVSLEFTAFDIEYHPYCDWDHLTITDGDGTTLLEKSCGYTIGANYTNGANYVIVGGKRISSSLPTVITSKTNVVKLSFKTDFIITRPGWNVTFTEAGTGEVR